MNYNYREISAKKIYSNKIDFAEYNFNTFDFKDIHYVTITDGGNEFHGHLDEFGRTARIYSATEDKINIFIGSGDWLLLENDICYEIEEMEKDEHCCGMACHKDEE